MKNCVGWLLSGSLFIAPALAGTPSEEVAAIVKHIEAKDCTAAAQRLNAALAKPSPAVLLLAGSMFENGVCLKPSVERAARMYTRAAEAPGAAARLASLYASKAASHQEALSIWWAAQADLPLPSPCLVAPEFRKDSEGFAQHLASWPAGRLEQCAHVAGVIGAMEAELQRLAPGQIAQGPVISITLDVARGVLRVEAGDALGTGVEAGAGTGINRSSAPGFQRHQEWAGPDPNKIRLQEAQRALAERVEALGQQALSKASRPSGELPAWLVRWQISGERH